jgi:hypothetical protein
MDDFYQTILNRHLPGVAGALVSMKFVKGSVTEKLLMAAGGAVVSYFATDYVSTTLGLPQGITGFLIGLFGMSILSRLWEWFQATEFNITSPFRWLDTSKKRKDGDGGK